MAQALASALQQLEQQLDPLRLAAEVAHASATVREGETGNHRGGCTGSRG